MDEKPKGLAGQPRSVKAIVAAALPFLVALIPGVSEVVHEAGGQDALVAAFRDHSGACWRHSAQVGLGSQRQPIA